MEMAESKSRGQECKVCSRLKTSSVQQSIYFILAAFVTYQGFLTEWCGKVSRCSNHHIFEQDMQQFLHVVNHART